MSDRRKRERDKQIQDRLQILLTKMLQDDDNKYCVDCDSKGPRWASWNLGIFLCIRCAGIHRNLGVHISRVKSVNLDTWTPQQVASMQVMGNSRARAIYEAEVQEDFRRPQSDTQLEVFIRAKYEKKKYLAREWTPTQPPDFPIGWNEFADAEKHKKDIRTVVIPSSTSPSLKKPVDAGTLSSATNNTRPSATKDLEVPAANSLSNDLLGLSVSSTEPVTSSTSSPEIAQSCQVSEPSKSNYSNDLLCLGLNIDTISNSRKNSDEYGDFSVSSSALGINQNQNINFSNNVHSKSESNLSGMNSLFGGGGVDHSENASKMSKDSILALFNQPPKFETPQPFQMQPNQGTNFHAGLGQANQKIYPSGNFGIGNAQANVTAGNFSSAMFNPFLAAPPGATAHSTPNFDQLSFPLGGTANGTSNFLQ